MLPRTWRQRSSLTKSMDTEDLAQLGMQLAKYYYYSSFDPMLDKMNLEYLKLLHCEFLETYIMLHLINYYKQQHE